MTIFDQPADQPLPFYTTAVRTDGSDARSCPVCGYWPGHKWTCPLNPLCAEQDYYPGRLYQVVWGLLVLVRAGAGEDSSEYGQAKALAESVGLLTPSEMERQEK